MSSNYILKISSAQSQHQHQHQTQTQNQHIHYFGGWDTVFGKMRIITEENKPLAYRMTRTMANRTIPKLKEFIITDETALNLIGSSFTIEIERQE